MMYTLFGIPNCDTVKKARTFLEKKKIVFEFVDFKKSPPTEDLIASWAKAYGELPVNKKGVTYKKFATEYETLSDKKKIEFLIKNTSMIKRPILQKNKSVLCFGFSEEDYKKSLGK